MSRRRVPLLLVPVLLLAATLFGCDPRSNSAELLPTSPEHGLLGTLTGTESEYKLVNDPLLPGITEAVSASALIGAEGGSVSLLGHSLSVPAGAVTELTLFTLTVLPSGYVEVDLTASVSSLLGVIDVGEKGFKKPVPVTLTYSRATNLKKGDKPAVARIHSLVGYGDMELLPSRIDATAKTVTAHLDHFSRYCLAVP